MLGDEQEKFVTRLPRFGTISFFFAALFVALMILSAIALIYLYFCIILPLILTCRSHLLSSNKIASNGITNQFSQIDYPFPTIKLI